MNKKDEALQAALLALEFSSSYLAGLAGVVGTSTKAKPGSTSWHVERAIKACREACAKVCEGFPANRDWVPGSLWGNIRSEMSAAIRARAAIAKATGEQA